MERKRVINVVRRRGGCAIEYVPCFQRTSLFNYSVRELDKLQKRYFREIVPGSLVAMRHEQMVRAPTHGKSTLLGPC